MKALPMLLSIWLMVAIHPGAAIAQQARRATVGDSVEATARAFERLFHGIDLVSAKREEAERAIRHAFVQQQNVLPISTQDRWNRVISIQERRDSLLISLVVDSAKRETLRERLIEVRPKSARWRSESP